MISYEFCSHWFCFLFYRLVCTCILGSLGDIKIKESEINITFCLTGRIWSYCRLGWRREPLQVIGAAF